VALLTRLSAGKRTYACPGPCNRWLQRFKKIFAKLGLLAYTSNMAHFDKLLSLPGGVVLTILTEWVEGVSLLHLDCALWNKSLRPSWLELLESPGFVLSLIPKNWDDRERDKLYQFAVSRNAKASVLCNGGSGHLDLMHRVLNI